MASYQQREQYSRPQTLKNHVYLTTPLKRWEYTQLRLSHIPEEVDNDYNLDEKAAKDGSVYIEARKGVYGLPKAGVLEQE